MDEHVRITKGMTRALKAKSVASCSECGTHIPSYPGKYPKNCPNCGSELVYDKPKSVELTQLIQSMDQKFNQLIASSDKK